MNMDSSLYCEYRRYWYHIDTVNTVGTGTIDTVSTVGTGTVDTVST